MYSTYAKYVPLRDSSDLSIVVEGQKHIFDTLWIVQNIKKNRAVVSTLTSNLCGLDSIPIIGIWMGNGHPAKVGGFLCVLWSPPPT